MIDQALIDNIFFATPEHGYFPLTCMIRILIAVICGGIIGLERTKRQKGAGIRTHILVAIGAALIMIISKYGFYDVVLTDGISLDASRIAANIVNGLGFLGAGIIFIKNTAVRGLTTATGLWASSGVAMALGAGLYFVGIFTTFILIIAQIVLHISLKNVDTSGYSELIVTLKYTPEAYTDFECDFAPYNVQIEGCRFKREGENETIRISARVSDKATNADLLALAQKNSNLISFEI